MRERESLFQFFGPLWIAEEVVSRKKGSFCSASWTQGKVISEWTAGRPTHLAAYVLDILRSDQQVVGGDGPRDEKRMTVSRRLADLGERDTAATLSARHVKALLNVTLPRGITACAAIQRCLVGFDGGSDGEESDDSARRREVLVESGLAIFEVCERNAEFLTV